MPIYEFVCKKCKYKFEELVFSSEVKVNCPECKNSKIKKLISTFSSKSSDGRNMAGSSCSGCTSTDCSGCK
ncbi:MAG: zinc ribbon domain-containing protein [Actinomycetia bacterium]|nr:zinc ribbon domain-containing protein [Actinomycetes bacterium]